MAAILKSLKSKIKEGIKMPKCRHQWEVDRWPGPMFWIEKCSKCGAEKTIDLETGQPVKRIPGTWDVLPQDLKNYRFSRGLTQIEMAALLHTPLSTFQKWEQAVQRIPGVVGVALTLMYSTDE
jgi:DNA-binding transcriptional regulator YiaG